MELREVERNMVLEWREIVRAFKRSHRDEVQIKNRSSQVSGFKINSESERNEKVIFGPYIS